MVETGTVYSLEELGNKFISFAQTSDSTAQAWELRQDKLNSFYGATLAVPLDDWAESGETPYFYISLCFRQITSSSYGSWLWGEDYYQAESYNHLTEDANSRYTRVTKYGGGDGNENAFRDTGQILQVGLHTTFDENLWMCEQGNVTCEAEAEAQVGGPNLIKGRLIRYPKRQGDPSEETIDMPNYPGTGCPWFTYSNDNEASFSFSTLGATYWFTKGNYNASITICYHGEVDVYQTMVFGRLGNTHTKSHLLPLYIAGGNQALKEDTYVYTPSTPRAKPTHVDGNSYYLNILNPAMSNSNPLHPTKFNGATMSNFRVLSSDGRWKDIYAHTQSASTKPDPTCSTEPPSSWHTMLNDVGSDLSSLHSALPFCSAAIAYFKDIYTIITPLTQYRSKALYHSIMPILNHFNGDDANYDERGIVGSLIDCYGYYSRTLPYGKIDTNDSVTNTVLSIPCGWEGRNFYYDTQHGMVTAQDSQQLANKAIQKTIDGVIIDKFIIDYK